MSAKTNLAYVYIKDKIINGTYRPSQKLTEYNLTEAIGVSRSTIKKALLMLEKENLIVLEKNKGATIKSYLLDEIINILEIREALEGIVIRNTAKIITSADLGRLEIILEAMKDQVRENKFDKYTILNQEFHNIIYNTSKKEQAVQMIKTINIQLSRLHFKADLIPGRYQESLTEHEDIIKALMSHDDKKAEKAARKHIANVAQVISSNYALLL